MRFARRLAAAAGVAGLAFLAWVIWISFAGFGVGLPGPIVADGPSHPVTVILGNSSLPEPFVRLSLELDGREIARPVLFVGLGFNTRRTVFQLPDGVYRIAVARPSVGVRSETTLEVSGPRWVMGYYWNNDGERGITLHVDDMAPGIASAPHRSREGNPGTPRNTVQFIFEEGNGYVLGPTLQRR